MAKIINSKQIKVKKIIDDIIKVMQKHFKKHIGSTTIPMDANGNIFPDPHLPKNNNKKP